MGSSAADGFERRRSLGPPTCTFGGGGLGSFSSGTEDLQVV